MAWYNRGKALVLDPSGFSIGEAPFALLLDNITIGLMRASYVFTVTENFYTDVTADSIVVAAGYTEPGAAGAESLATKAVTQDDTGNRGEFDADNSEFTGIGNGTNDTFEDIVLCRQQDAGFTEANTVLLSNAAVGATLTNGGNITLIWNVEGILQTT